MGATVINPFSHLYAQCNVGDPADKHAGLADGPIIIDLEPVGLCNFRCVMCPTGLQALGRPGGMMSHETFRSILDKTAPFKTALRFIGWGEPLMHPDIAWFIDLAAQAGRLTHLNTNGSKIFADIGMARRLVDAGLSSIKFSFQGADRESYSAMRRVDFFEDLFASIGRMRQARGWNTRPFIAASTTTTTETPEMIEAFRQRMEPLVDQLTIGKTIFEFIDMAAVPPKRRAELEEAAAFQSVLKKHPSPCPEVFDKLSIHWDGQVVLCCNDVRDDVRIGNIVTDELRAIWQHPKIEEYRARLSKGDYSQHLCNTCFDYMELTEGNAKKGATISTVLGESI